MLSSWEPRHASRSTSFLIAGFCCRTWEGGLLQLRMPTQNGAILAAPHTYETELVQRGHHLIYLCLAHFLHFTWPFLADQILAML